MKANLTPALKVFYQLFIKFLRKILQLQFVLSEFPLHLTSHFGRSFSICSYGYSVTSGILGNCSCVALPPASLQSCPTPFGPASLRSSAQIAPGDLVSPARAQWSGRPGAAKHRDVRERPAVPVLRHHPGYWCDMRTNRCSHPHEFGRVGLVIGGNSAEREVSLDGGQAVAAALARNSIEHEVFDGVDALFSAISAGLVERVFNLLHGPGGEDGTLQGALELMGVPVTGSGVLGSALTMDKVRSKWLFQQRGIPTQDFVVLDVDDDAQQVAGDKFELPLFVKPVAQGSSVGVSKVSQWEQLDAAITAARQYGNLVIVEPAVEGPEFFAGILGGCCLPLIRVETPHEFYDYAAKYESDETSYFCPCGLPSRLEEELQAMSLEAFNLLDASGWGRVDFLLNENQEPRFLEVNTTPGMTDHSLVPQAAAQLGIGFDELVWKILETSMVNDEPR